MGVGCTLEAGYIFRVMSLRDGAAPAAATVSVTCRLFGRYAETSGLDRLALTLTAPATAADAVARLRLALREPGFLPLHPLVAVNHEHAEPSHPLKDGDEVALLPPLAGG